MQEILKNFFTSNIGYSDNVSYRRIIMINSILSLFIFIFIIFGYLNISLFKQFEIAVFDFFTAIFSAATLIKLRKDKNVTQAALTTTILLTLFMFFFILKNQDHHLGIIWSVFIPIFAILFNGKKIGLYISIIFYSVMFVLAYDNIGVWNLGFWNEQDLLRFIGASFVLTYVIYTVESAHEKADKELIKVRENEQNMLQKLQEQAITDDLTGMYNRRYFNTIAPSILNNARRENGYITFFILDIDFFKKYNDFYGHQKGDEILKSVAKQLIAYMQRESDLVFRLGGEEFAGIIQSKEAQELTNWLSKIHECIEELNLEHLETELKNKRLTVSCGVCTVKATKETTIEFLYKCADDALYKAKAKGRNRTHFA